MTAGLNATAKLHALTRTAGFWIADKTYQDKDELPWHRHDRAGICIVLSGEVIEDHPSGEGVYKPGEVIVRPPSHRHRNRFCAGGARMLALEIEPAYLSAMEKRCFPLTMAAQFRSSEIMGIGARIQRELRRIDDLSSIVFEGLCLEVFGRAFREMKRVADDGLTEWLRDVRHRIARSFHKHLTLEELAADAGVHPIHLAQRHRNTFSETVGAY